MRAIRFARTGPAAEVIELHEIEPSQPGAGEALVRMRAAAVNPADLLLTQGRYGKPPALPATPGVEGVGEIAALGPGADGMAVGQRVVLFGKIGTWQELVTHDASRLVPVPDGVSDEAAAQFANPFSAAVMLEELGLARGAWLAQSAASSALGRIIVPLARLRGVRTINLVRRAEQADELKALGAEHVLVTDGEDTVARIRALTGGAGVAAALDAVGGPTGSDLVKALGPGGTMMVHGVLDGRPIEVHPGWLLAKGATVRGFWIAHWLDRADRARRDAVARALFRLLADGTLSLPVDATYDLADVRQAVAHAEKPGRQGKVLLTMGGA